MIYTAIWYLGGSICSMWQWGKVIRTEKNMNMSSQGHYFQVWKWKDLMFSREHASFHYLLTNIRVDGTSSLLEGWTRNTSAPSAFSARGNHTRLVVATGRLNFAPSKLQRISTLICLFFFRFCHSCIITWLEEGKTCPGDNSTLGEVGQSWQN